jgi:hypothetical protein
MSIRERTWKNRRGIQSTWILTYSDHDGKRRQESFTKRADAKARELVVKVGVRDGTHTAHSVSATITEAGEAWLANGKAAELEPSTLNEYRRLFERHIRPHLGAIKLSKLTAPIVVDFRARLRNGSYGYARSATLAKQAMTVLGAILSDALQSGRVAQNVVASLGRGRQRGRKKAAQKRPLEIGVDIFVSLH